MSHKGCERVAVRQELNSVLGFVWNESVQIQLAQCWFPGLAISSAKIWIYLNIFQTKYTETILSNSPRKLLWLEITKMLIAV